MDFLAHFFDISTILFTVWNYPVSAVELAGTVFGLICVWLAARQHLLTWPFGMLNIVCFFAVFYQVRLYSDMFLQLYFFAMSVYGWISWTRQKRAHIPVSVLSWNARFFSVAVIVAATLAGGFAMQNIHVWIPTVFQHPASYPFVDTFIAVGSVVAMVFQARRNLENWVLWILIDVVAVFVYFERNILLIAAEYVIFLGLASYGLWLWLQPEPELSPSR